MAHKQFKFSLSSLTQLINLRDEGGLRTLNTDFGGSTGILTGLEASIQGGTKSSDIQRREYFYGRNELNFEKPKGFWRLAWEAAQDVTLIILLVAGLLSMALEFGFGTEEDYKTAWIEAFAIFVTIAAVAFISAYTDLQKEKQFRELQALADSKEKCTVIRDGKDEAINPKDLVVGDVMKIGQGLVLPGDGILIEMDTRITCDEAAMTGEAKAIAKDVGSAPFMLSGTSVEKGSGLMVIVAVGLFSEEGTIHRLVTGAGEEEVHMLKSRDTKFNDQVDAHVDDLHLAQATVLDEEHTQQQEDRVQKSKGKKTSILTAKLSILAARIGYLALAAGILTFVGMLIHVLAIYADEWDHGKHWIFVAHAFMTAIAILVVAIPEGLPLAVTIALAYSVRKMGKEDNCLVRVLASCETMGNASTICSDKTGTLTKNEMTVVRTFIANTDYKEVNTSKTSMMNELSENVRTTISEGGAFNSDSNSNYGKVAYELLKEARAKANTDTGPKTKEKEYTESQINMLQDGNKTECAILKFGDLLVDNASYTTLRNEAQEKEGNGKFFVKQFAFDHDKKRMSTVVSHAKFGAEGTKRIYCKGASELVIQLCDFFQDKDGSIKPLSAEKRQEIVTDVIEAYAADALRVLCLAYRDVPADADLDTDDELAKGMVFSAVVGIQDPERDEVPEAVAACARAGVTVRMVTGDNAVTARAIAVNCGIIEQNAPAHCVMTGSEFRNRISPDGEKIDFDEFDKIWRDLKVIARCKPEDKLKMVTGLIHFGEVVAVTGDGTNDAPALSKADVGFAMDSGTQVARNAADITLLDDNFASTVKAIMWGRNVYDSISKFLVFQLTVNVVAVLFSFFSAIINKESPLKATQMLWVNLIMDTLAAGALATEPPTLKLLERAPYKRNSPLLTKLMARQILGHSIYQLTVLFFVLYWSYEKVVSVTHDNCCSEVSDACNSSLTEFAATWTTSSAFDVYNVSDDAGGVIMKECSYDKMESKKFAILGLDHGLREETIENHIVTEHIALLFNIFVWMQLFNEVNSRKIDGRLDVWTGLFNNKLFIGIMIGQILGQVLIVEGFGFIPQVFATKPLSWQAWLLSIAFGAGELVWNVVIAYIFPEAWVPQAIINIFKINLSDEEEADSEKDDPEGRGIMNKVSEKSLNASALPMPYADEDKVAGAGSTEPARGWSILRSSRVRAQLRSVSAFTTLSRNIKTANTNRALQERVNRLAQSNILGMADVVAQTQMQKRTPAQQLWHQAAKTINRKGSEETLEPISNRTDLNDEDAVDTRSPSYSKAFVQNSQL